MYGENAFSRVFEIIRRGKPYLIFRRRMNSRYPRPTSLNSMPPRTSYEKKPDGSWSQIKIVFKCHMMLQLSVSLINMSMKIKF